MKIIINTINIINVSTQHIMFMKQEQKKKRIKKIYIKIIISPLRYNPYFPCLLCIARGNHQESKGGGGGKALLYSKKTSLNIATLAISPSKSCP